MMGSLLADPGPGRLIDMTVHPNIAMATAVVRRPSLDLTRPLSSLREESLSERHSAKESHLEDQRHC
jgi:hypothetical protein